MSEVNNLTANRHIYNAIKAIALHKMVDPRGVIHNTKKVSGYVVKVHTEGELCGTVDVQEYAANPLDFKDVDGDMPVGLHEGVYLSAIQNNENGLVIIPFLYSDVVIATDPETLREYVIQYSHADQVKVDAHSVVSIGTTETKPFEETEDSPDVPDLEKTGKHAHTVYTPTSALTTVAKSDKPAEQSTLEITADKIVSQHDKAQIMLDAKQILEKYNAKEIVINDSGVYLGSGKATEPGVLGNQLATVLLDLMKALSQMMTATMMGPQPPVNLAQFVALQAKIATYQASISGFLSKTVKVAE